MSGPEQQPAPPGWLGGTSRLADGPRWQALAAESVSDLATMQRTALQLRDAVRRLDLMNSLRALGALAQGSAALARVVASDVEAVQVLESAGVAVPAELVALFPGVPGGVRATPVDGGWRLDGRQQRTVHLDALTRALLVAGTVDGDRVFSFRTDDPGVTREWAPAHTIAPDDPGGPVTFRSVGADAVGTVAWWAGRHESFDTMLRDAACWFGSTIWLCRAIESTLSARTDPTDLPRIGRVDVWVNTARLAMREAAAAVEADPTSPAAELAARRSVAVTATTADIVIRLVALLSDARVRDEHTEMPTRLAQLQIALRQYDGDENMRALGALVAAADPGSADPD